MQYESTELRLTTQDLTGKPFDRWNVLHFAGYHKYKPYWTCQCICMTIRDVLGTSLCNRTSQSCGCLNIEMAREQFTTHGKSRTSEYKIWGAMIRRCESPTNGAYAYYGARGITVCEAWHNFQAFYADMGPRPTTKHSLERLKNSEGYNPDNCIWGTPEIQNRNTRRNVLLTYNGTTQCAEDWAPLVGLQAQLIRYRANHGWSDDETLTTPATHANSHKYSHNRKNNSFNKIIMILPQAR